MASPQNPRAHEELEHLVRRSGRRVEIFLTGRLYAASLPALARLIDAEEKKGVEALTLDFAGVTHLDSRGIGALVGWNRHFHGEQIEFYARHLQGEVRQALQVCNLIQLFHPGPAPDDPREKLRRERDGLWTSIDYIEQLLAGIGEGIIGVNARGAVLFANPAAERMLGRAETEILGQSLEALLARLSPDSAASSGSLAANGAGPTRSELSHRDLQGATATTELTYIPLRRDGADMGALIGLLDVTDKKRAESLIRESEARLRTFIDHSPAVIYLKDLEGRYLLVNREYVRLFPQALKEPLGKTDYDFFPREMADAFRKNDIMIAETGLPFQIEEYAPLPDGVHSYLSIKFPVRDSSGKIYAVGGVSSDITDLKKQEFEHRELEHQLREAQKLESLGLLAGGIAHDFNNLLVAILGNASLVKADLPAGSTLAPRVDAIEIASERAAELCQQMLAYSGKGKFVTEPFDLSEAAREMTQLLEVAISKNAKLRCALSPEPAMLEGDPTQIRQVIMNLILNASESLGEGEGEISLRTSIESCTAEDLKGIPADSNPAAGDYVVLEVSDAGCGMDAATIERMFDPFFSTKFVGRGLGLAAVLGIARGHRGIIKVASEPGRGTTVKVYFPRSRKAAPAKTRDAEPSTPLPAGGAALIVDDEEVVRGLARAILEASGYEVIEAADGRAGIDAYAARAADIQFVLLDITMPGISGEQVFEEIRQINPEACVIVSSGYTREEIAGRFADPNEVSFIQKPYRAQDLLAKIAEAVAAQ